MKERILNTIILVALLLSTLSITSYAASEPSTWALQKVSNAKKAGIITSSVTQDYQGNITREQFCELVVTLYEKLVDNKEIKIYDIFDDTDNEEILKAYQLGIVKGVADNLFSPNTFITRQEICVMLTRCIDVAVESANIQDYEITQFADMDRISDWALSSVQYAFDNNIIRGVGANKIEPLGNTTCEQAILLAYRIYENYENNSAEFSEKDFVFHDEAFEYSVRRSIALDLNYEWGTTYDGEITEELLNGVTSLLLYDMPNGKKLSSVRDINKLNNLKIIEFENDINNVTDMEAISNSEVEFDEFGFELCVRMSLPNGYRNMDGSIYIGKISNDMLQQITELSTWHLPDTIKLESLEDLKFTPNIERLSLYPQNIKISDYSNITNLKNLKALELSGVTVEDDSFLYNLNITDAIGFPNFGAGEVMYLYLGDDLNYQEALMAYETVKEKFEFLDSQISKAETDYDKYKIIHDYLIENMEYDYDFIQNAHANDIVDNIYLSLFEGKGICDVYARSYQHLCRYFGLECWFVSGDAKGIIYEDDVPSWGLGHAWNIIKLDGNFYHVDVTWDDPIGGNDVGYNYFLVSDDTISDDHRWGGEEYGENMFDFTADVNDMERKIPSCPVDFEHGLSEIDLTETDANDESSDDNSFDNGDRVIDGIHYNEVEIIGLAEEELNIPYNEEIRIIVSAPEFNAELQEYIIWVKFYENESALDNGIEKAAASWCIESQQFYTRFSEFENY